MENVRSKLKIDSLYVELAGLLLAAVLISGAFFFVLNRAGEKIITDTFTDSDYIEKMSSAYLDSLQKYIREEQAASNDSAKLTEWVKRQKIVSIQVYKDEILTYDSNYPDAEVEEAGAEGGYYEWEYYYTVQFADGTADVFLYGFFAYKIYTYAMIGELLLAVVLLILIVTLGIRRTVRYIGRLKEECDILGSGDLDYTVTVQGHNELSLLAEGLDNIVSNIVKYAEKEAPVKIYTVYTEEYACLVFANRVCADPEERKRTEGSTNIGLHNVEKMMKSMSGLCRAEQTGEVFHVTLRFPWRG